MHSGTGAYEKRQEGVDNKDKAGREVPLNQQDWVRSQM